LNDVLFHTGRSSLTRHAKHRLNKMAKYLRELPGLESIHVIGFADSRGTERYNDALSERRAHSVARYLRSRGVSVSMDVGGMGEDFPIASNATTAGRRYNRRVEITLGRVTY
jgi:outer membrane protein OmpA-like peptidoglycan-associated protein